MKTQQQTKAIYLNEKEVAKITGLSVSTLQNNRFYQKGMNYVKVGRSVRYSEQEVLRYMEEHTVTVQKRAVL